MILSIKDTLNSMLIFKDVSSLITRIICDNTNGIKYMYTTIGYITNCFSLTDKNSLTIPSDVCAMSQFSPP